MGKALLFDCLICLIGPRGRPKPPFGPITSVMSKGRLQDEFFRFYIYQVEEAFSSIPMEMRKIIRHARGMRSSQTADRPVRGYTLVQLVITMAIGLTMAAVSVPLISNAMGYFRFRSAVSSVAAAIQSGRNQAIFRACPYQTVFSAANKTYETKGEPADATNTCTAAFACPNGAASCAAPWAGQGSNITLDADQTLTFNPGGTMVSPSAVNGVTTMVMTYPNGNRTATIRISRFGGINVTYTP